MAETQMERDATAILELLASKPRDAIIPAAEIAAESQLSAERVNDAVALLVDSGFAEWIQTFGTDPFDFAETYLTSRGRYEQQRIAAARWDANASLVGPPTVRTDLVPVGTATLPLLTPPSPVGSPYGFTEADWENVSLQKSRKDILFVVLGYQFKSQWYETPIL